MPVPSESEQEDHEAPADLAEVNRRLEGLREDLAKARVQGIGAFDQFVAYLRDLEHSMDTATSLDLPPGQRVELVEAVCNLMRSAIIGMDLEEAAPPGQRGVHTETVDQITELLLYAREKRIENRAKNLAAELCSGDDWAVYDWIVTHPTLLGELVDDAGLEPSDGKIREWLMRNYSRHRGRR